VAELSTRLGLPLHCIGHFTNAAETLQLRGHDGRLHDVSASGYDHFGQGA
jgi:hypothetical protein